MPGADQVQEDLPVEIAITLRDSLPGLADRREELPRHRQ